VRSMPPGDAQTTSLARVYLLGSLFSMSSTVLEHDASANSMEKQSTAVIDLTIRLPNAIKLLLAQIG
jgi:hypothetical protein